MPFSAWDPSTSSKEEAMEMRRRQRLSRFQPPNGSLGGEVLAPISGCPYVLGNMSSR